MALKLDDLKFGTMNRCTDDNATGVTGDPRRTKPLTSLRRTSAETYAVDTTKNRAEWEGIVVLTYPIDYPGYADTAGLLKQYQQVVTITDQEKYKKVQAARKFAYKVFVPELDCRPVPAVGDPNDPITVSLGEIYANIPGLEQEIAPGTAVVVHYEDPASLYGGSIVRIVTDQVQIENTSYSERTGGGRSGFALKASFDKAPFRNPVGNTHRLDSLDPDECPEPAEVADADIPVTSVADFMKNVKGDFAKGSQRKVLELFIQKALERGFTDRRALTGMACVIGKESGFNPRSERGKYSVKRFKEVFKGFWKKKDGTIKMTDAQIAEVVKTPRSLFEYVYGTRRPVNGNLTDEDGYLYRGRGLVQITGRGAYLKYSALMKQAGYEKWNLTKKGAQPSSGLKIDKTYSSVPAGGNPDLANDPEIAAQIAILWFENNYRIAGWYGGSGPSTVKFSNQADANAAAAYAVAGTTRAGYAKMIKKGSSRVRPVANAVCKTNAQTYKFVGSASATT